jgi:hypothetical protein
MSRTYAISITFMDVPKNEFVELGWAAWPTRREQLAQWNSIPAAPGETPFLLDKRGANGYDLEDTKCVERSTVAKLLSRSDLTRLIGERRRIERRRIEALRQRESAA